MSATSSFLVSYFGSYKVTLTYTAYASATAGFLTLGVGKNGVLSLGFGSQSTYTDKSFTNNAVSYLGGDWSSVFGFGPGQSGSLSSQHTGYKGVFTSASGTTGVRVGPLDFQWSSSASIGSDGLSFDESLTATVHLPGGIGAVNYGLTAKITPVEPPHHPVPGNVVGPVVVASVATAAGAAGTFTAGAYVAQKVLARVAAFGAASSELPQLRTEP